MERKITIQDIADMVNVSKSSVSRYLNNGYVSKENADKIKIAIEKTGFQTNFFAKRLKTKRSKLIGIVLPRIDSVTVGKLLTGINRRLEEEQYQGLILSSELNVAKELANINNLHQQGVDGIIVNSIAITKRHIELMKSLEIPIVFTGQKSEFVNCVKVDDYQAGQIMGNYVKEKGHKKIVFLGVHEKDYAVGVERKQGFIDAVTNNNQGCNVHFVETGFSFTKAYDRGCEVLKYQPTAIVCATDNISLGIIRYLHEQQIKVPKQISVAGFGGYDVGTVSYPRLTTVAFDFDLIGVRIAQGILDLIEGKELVLNKDVPLQLIERESVMNIS
jgi:LacI family transcriptional regulator, sucrose operon repressor